jgi:hypothetical protein
MNKNNKPKVEEFIWEKVSITYEVGHKIETAKGVLKEIQDGWIIVERNSNLITAINTSKVVSIRKVRGGFNNDCRRYD